MDSRLRGEAPLALDKRARGNDGSGDRWRRESYLAQGYSANIDLLRKATPQILTCCGG
jgi:hypothetical protein